MEADEDDDECPDCEGRGHLEGCDSLEPAWDLGDLMCRYPCDGCCPRGCRPTGLQAEQDAAGKKLRRMFE